MTVMKMTIDILLIMDDFFHIAYSVFLLLWLQGRISKEKPIDSFVLLLLMSFKNGASS